MSGALYFADWSCENPTRLNSHYFHIIGDGHQPNSRGLYTHYKDSLLKVGWVSHPQYNEWIDPGSHQRLGQWSKKSPDSSPTILSYKMKSETWSSPPIGGNKITQMILSIEIPSRSLTVRPWSLYGCWTKIMGNPPNYPLKNRVFHKYGCKNPQIIHLFIGFWTTIFTIHFGGFSPIFGNTHTLWWTNIAGWNIPMFNRKYIFNPGPFSSQLC